MVIQASEIRGKDDLLAGSKNLLQPYYCSERLFGRLDSGHTGTQTRALLHKESRVDFRLSQGPGNFFYFSKQPMEFSASSSTKFKEYSGIQEKRQILDHTEHSSQSFILFRL